MLINLLTLMTGIVGLITTTIAVFRHKTNCILNKYLIVFLTLLSIRYMIRGFSIYFEKIPNQIFTFMYIYFLILMIVCMYLYFRDLVFNKKWQPKDLIHFIAPSVIVGLFAFNFQYHYEYDRSVRILYITLLLFCYLIYNFLGYRLLIQNIWSKKSDIPLLIKQNKTIKNWTLYLYIGTLIQGLIIIIVYITNDFNYNNEGNNYQMGISSVFWLIFFTKMLATPELLYGYDLIKAKTETSKKEEVLLNTVWILNITTEITNQKDLKISDLVNTNLNNYIQQIENLSFNTHTFRDPLLTLEDFAKKLHIPIVHLLYVFKYNCNLTFVEYKKTIRIQDAITLLENDFLKTSTLESLAKVVGFSSYKPFYSSFKSITTMTPQEYCKNLK